MSFQVLSKILSGMIISNLKMRLLRLRDVTWPARQYRAGCGESGSDCKAPAFPTTLHCPEQIEEIWVVAPLNFGRVVMTKQESKGLKGSRKFNQFIFWKNLSSSMRTRTLVHHLHLTWYLAPGSHSALNEFVHGGIHYLRQTGRPTWTWWKLRE